MVTEMKLGEKTRIGNINISHFYDFVMPVAHYGFAFSSDKFQMINYWTELCVQLWKFLMDFEFS